ncbi:MAG: hypothetical protein ACRD4L_14495 [Pyrinomonadaceae bacterium]
MSSHQATPETTNIKSIKKENTFLKKAIIYLVVAVIIFSLGFIPTAYKAYKNGVERDQALNKLKLIQIQNSLASAVIDSRRGDYEPARVAASNFFTTLGEEMDKKTGSALSDTEKISDDEFFKQRDDVITLLARSDPAAADRLSDLYINYRNAMKGN